MSSWNLVWNTTFQVDMAARKWNCDNNNSCPGLAPAYRAHWWAYPVGWPDTATQRGYPVGGYYDPDTTVTINNGMMHIRMWRKGGPVHSCAVVPTPAMGRKYGRYVETFRVSKTAPGYKSAHLLWPASGNQNTTSFEVDYPENEWDQGISGFLHAGSMSQVSCDTGVRWGDGQWHTTEIQWTPTSLKFLMDGHVKLTETDSRYIPTVPMDWIIQNESALNGEKAAVDSSAQLDIKSVEYYSYVP